MSGATIGIIGGIVGTAVGLAGGIIGTRASIRNAPGPAARAVVVRFSIGLWAYGVVFLTMMGLAIAGVIPLWVWWVVFAVSMAALGPAIVLTNRRMAAAAREPETGRSPDREAS